MVRPSFPPFFHPASLIATWFGCGLLPRIPGTWGSLAALPIAWFILVFAGSAGLLLAVVIVEAVGFWATAVYCARSGRHDPGQVVVDEVAGQWLALTPVSPDPLLFVLGFFLFRLADMAKVGPIRWIDRRMRGTPGIMLDDLAAGAAVAATLYPMQLWVS
jgi:phosphatidylglycerophosphatase A